MATAPFGAVLEAALKENIQNAKLTAVSGVVVHPRFFCCVSGTTVGVAKDPVGVGVADAGSVCTNTVFDLDYSRSWSPSSTIASWHIDWGDGNTSNGAWPGAGSQAHPTGYILPGTYTITLTVTDLLGATGVDTTQVVAIDCAVFPLIAFAACGTSGVWYTENAGVSWEERGGGVLDGATVYDLKVNPFTIGLSLMEVWAATSIGLYKSSDSGASWEQLTPLPVVTPYCLAPSPCGDLEFYVMGLDASGYVHLVYTDDGGATWSASRQLSGNWQALWEFDAGVEGWVFVPTGAGTGVYDPADGYPGGGGGLPSCAVAGSGAGCLSVTAPGAGDGGEWRFYGSPFYAEVGDYVLSQDKDPTLGGLRTETGFHFVGVGGDTEVNGACPLVPNWEFNRGDVNTRGLVDYISVKWLGGGPGAPWTCKHDDIVMSAANAPFSYQLPTEGYAHLLSVSADGLYVYVVLLNDAGNPIILRNTYDLSTVEVIDNLGAGTWGGVVADQNVTSRLWAFGDFGAVKVQISDDYGDTLTDVTDGGWGGGEVVRPLLPSLYDPGDVVAILNTALESWETRDSGDTWAQIGATAVPFGAQCGARDFIDDQIVFIGALVQNINNLQGSPNLGFQWLNRSLGINAEITSIVIVG